MISNTPDTLPGLEALALRLLLSLELMTNPSDTYRGVRQQTPENQSADSLELNEQTDIHNLTY